MTYRYVWAGLLCLLSSCSPTPSSTPTEEAPPLNLGSPSVCEELRNGLPPVVPPVQIPSGRSMDPFSPEVQEWLKKQVLPVGVYAPIGRWKGPEARELWFIELMSPDGTLFYALLTDSTCNLLDTLLCAYQQVFPNRVSQAQALLERDGSLLRRSEERVTDFVGEEPRTTTTTSESRYQVDWAAGKLRRL
ncbi:MAG: hypothetical protein NZ989_00820 [Bacteroidia bacterium]|nr:hypothetical protein [Bacteroidia bacterium]MDW8056652.1 hypothetical protein [Bacteroidia bacterium]